MNNGYYQNPVFSGTLANNSNEDIYNNVIPDIKDVQTDFIQMNMSESYIDNILRLNKGKKTKIYITIPNSKEEKIFEGILETVGKDHIIMSNPSTGEWYLIPIIYLNYIIFEEKINY